MRVNLNKLLPRLSIQAKLAVAFILLAILPLALLAVITTIGSVRQLGVTTRAALSYDLEVAAVRATREIVQVEHHLRFLTDAFLEGLLTGDTVEGIEEASRISSTFLRADSSAIFRVKAVDANGRRLFMVGSVDRGEYPPQETEPTREFLYVWAATGVELGRRVILPVEVREFRTGYPAGVIPAVAVIQPVRDAAGQLLGVGVVEASAGELFNGLDTSSPGLEGTTGLVTPEGLFLYHSDRKRDWRSLLADQEQVNLLADFSSQDAEVILSGVAGSLTNRREIVGYRPIQFGDSPDQALILYRSIPTGVLGASVRRFLVTTTVVGIAITAVVLVVSVLASDQFTRPILRLSRAANQLAKGGEPDVVIHPTNDEIEDLSRDFARMAASLTDHRRFLEDMVSERTRDLDVARKELLQIVEHAGDAIVGLDAEGCVHLWNDGAQRLFGYESAEAAGRTLDELILPDGAQFEAEVKHISGAILENGGVVGLRTVRRGKDGSRVQISMTETAIRAETGEFLGTSVVARDDRLQSELEDQMLRSERLAAISIMAAGIAHELNNPLAVLANRIELMERDVRDSPSESRLHKDLSVLGGQVVRIQGITTDLLSFAREEDGEPAPVNLRDLAARVKRLLAHSYLKKGVSLELDLEEGVPLISGAEKAVETVLVNLLINAVQATPAGGSVWVRIRSQTSDGGVELEVEDTGGGIASDARARIFQPFFTTKSESGGTGLGLAVCRAVMERHGGSIRLRESRSGGTRFVAVFPVRQEAA